MHESASATLMIKRKKNKLMKTKKVCVFVCVEQQNVQLNTATVSLNKQLWVRLL